MSSHINEKGLPRMVDVGSKEQTRRKAIARGFVQIPVPPKDEDSFKLVDNEWWSPKGPVFQTAVLSGIQGAKRTSETIPLCHPLNISSCDIDISVIDAPPSSIEPQQSAGNYMTIQVTASVQITGRTGVEMEALCAVSSACLTIYDMGKSLTRGIRILAVELLEKSGGKHKWRYNEK